MLLDFIWLNRNNLYRMEVFKLIERTSRKSLFAVTLQDRLQLYLFLRNSPRNVALHTLFQKN